MIRVVLALVVSMAWSLRQVDINNAFLNGDLHEEIYMVQPLGFEQQWSNRKQLESRLRKALYGLKQAPRAWFHKLKEFLVATKFEVSKADNSLFIHHEGSQLLYVLVYVDNIIVIGNDFHAIDQFVKELDVQFSLKDLGKLSNYTQDGFFLNRKKYILDLLQRVSMDRSKGSPTPMITICHFSAHVGSPIKDEHLYRSIIGALQYVVITRLDIAFSMNKIC
ncbi:Retrovirus-related Pol polyprotein from transposon TNT 1-94 [Gossypium australe]|uniref:Retrovirus-related Pol polyprotein from transposon TNT 1-94 n=1 Tax=Gossypium australe TaxID=47621 RepID=A0A5B6VMI2_9ROSI|nr:Retrovirus-related Pol polyprotein from transposon TNT 1-94 [Gossypium australe]